MCVREPGWAAPAVQPGAIRSHPGEMVEEVEPFRVPDRRADRRLPKRQRKRASPFCKADLASLAKMFGEPASEICPRTLWPRRGCLGVALRCRVKRHIPPPP